MSKSRRPYGAPQPEPIDDNEDRMGSMDELNFDEDEPHTRIADLTPDDDGDLAPLPGGRPPNPEMRDTLRPDQDLTDDDLNPETLIHEDGAQSAREAGESGPADCSLSVVGEDEIGGGDGLDEAELAELDPLDGKPEK